MVGNIVSTRYGKMKIIDGDKVISTALAFYGEWAMDELNLMKAILTPGMHVLDIGAFIGTHALAFSEFTGDSGHIYAFEPRKEFFSILAENIALNNIRNISLYNIGISEKEQILNLEALDLQSDSNFGAFALDTTKNSSKHDTYQITVSTIDQLKIKKIGAIKIDVEGMERNVLDGAINTILRDYPILFCECNSVHSGNKLLEFAQNVNYKAYAFLAKAYNPTNFNKIKKNIYEGAKECMLVLIPQEKIDETLKKTKGIALIPIDNIEDLILPLLHKPQYAHEVLAHTKSLPLLGLAYPSPASTALQTKLQDTEIQLLNLTRSYSWILTLPFKKINRWLLTSKQQSNRYLNRILKFNNSRFDQLDPRNKNNAQQNTNSLPIVSYHPSAIMRFIHKGFRSINKQWVKFSPYFYYAIQKQPKIKKKNKLGIFCCFVKKKIINNSILIFDHNLGGGTNTHSRSIIKEYMKANFSILRVYNYKGAWFIQTITNKETWLFYTKDIQQLFNLLSCVHSKKIIVNSLYGGTNLKLIIFYITNLAKTLKLPLEVKVHDFFALCPSMHLLNNQLKYCGLPTDKSVCNNCLITNINWYPGWYPLNNRPTDIDNWREPFINLFEAASKIIFFDKSGVEIISKLYSLDKNKIQIVPHKIDYFTCERPVNLAGPLHIGILGVLTIIKGEQVAIELTNYINHSALNIKVTIVGPSAIQASTLVNTYGAYKSEELLNIIEKNNINLIFTASIIPETFVYTISEAMKMGLPILAFDLGAQGNRVKNYELGKVIPLGSTPEIILGAMKNLLHYAQEKYSTCLHINYK